MDGLDELIGKRMKIAFDDGRAVSIKVGILTGYDDNFLFLKTDDSRQMISINKIIRSEEVKK